jgi:hypothetical protein
MAWERGGAAPMARAKAAALPAHCGRKEKGAGSVRRAGPACLAARGRVDWLGLPDRSGAGGLARPLGRLAQKLKKISFSIKIEFLNLPRLWKFVEGDLGGILRWGFFLNSSRLLKDFRKNIICHAMQCALYKIYFWKVFHMNYNLICIFICSPICANLFILVKSGCYTCP